MNTFTLIIFAFIAAMSTDGAPEAVATSLVVDRIGGFESMSACEEMLERVRLSVTLSEAGVRFRTEAQCVGPVQAQL